MTPISQRIDKAVRMTAASASVTPPVPHAVKIDFMRTCNLRCSFCYHSQLQNKTGQMAWPLYTRIIDELAEIGVEVIPDPIEWSVLLPKITDRQFEAMIMGWGGDIVEDYYPIFARDHLATELPVGADVVRSTAVMTDMLAARGIKATFFILGEVAAAHPKLAPGLAAAGHEIGVHGYRHRQVFKLTREQFAAEVRRAAPLVMKLRRLGGMPLLAGLVRALPRALSDTT